jgi:hypothetical protein
VEAAPHGRPTTWLRRPATSWSETDFSKSVELPHDPINTPYGGNENTHTTFWRFHLQTLILSVVARRSLGRRVGRL